MERETKPEMVHTSPYLRKLQAYENTGWQPDEITPKKGSVAEQQKVIEVKPKHKVRLIVKQTPDCRRNFYTVNVDGKEMGLKEFAEKIGVGKDTVRSWVTHKAFELRLREKGII